MAGALLTDSSRSNWLVYAGNTRPCSSSHAPLVRFLLEITSKMRLKWPGLQLGQRDCKYVTETSRFSGNLYMHSQFQSACGKQLSKCTLPSKITWPVPCCPFLPSLPQPVPTTCTSRLKASLRYCHVRHCSVLSLYVMLKVPWFPVRKNSLR